MIAFFGNERIKTGVAELVLTIAKYTKADKAPRLAKSLLFVLPSTYGGIVSINSGDYFAVCASFENEDEPEFGISWDDFNTYAVALGYDLESDEEIIQSKVMDDVYDAFRAFVIHRIM